MMDSSIAAEGLKRLSAISLLLLCGGTLACSDGEPVDLQAREAGEATDRPVPWGNPELAEEQGLLWDTPPLPSPMTLIIDGKVVLDEITHSFLLTPWSTHCADEGFGLDVAQLTEGFLADPEELFYPLVRGVLLLREAEARFPKLNDEEVEHFQKQMEVAVGTAMEALLDRYGQDGWERHVQRQLRKRLLKAEFSALAPEVTEDDVYRLYSTSMAQTEEEFCDLAVRTSYLMRIDQTDANVPEHDTAVALAVFVKDMQKQDDDELVQCHNSAMFVTVKILTQWPRVSHLASLGTEHEAIPPYQLTLPMFFNVSCYPPGDETDDTADANIRSRVS